MHAHNTMEEGGRTEGGHIALLELARQVAPHEGGLAHSAVAYQDQLEFRDEVRLRGGWVGG